MVRAIQGHACNSPFSSGRRRRELDYYAQGSLVAAVVALAIAGYLRVWARDGGGGGGSGSLSFLIFLWCFPEYLWKTLDSAFWHRVSLAAVLFIPPFVLRYSGSAVRTRPRWYPVAFASGVWISAVFAATIVSDRLFFSPWWNVAALLYVYPYLGLSLHIVVRHGFRAKPSSIERKKFQFLLVGGGVASLVAPLNFLPGTGIPFPPLGSFAILLFFYFMATGILHLHFFEFPDIVGRAIILVIQVFAFAVVFGILEVVSGRKFWFPLAGTFLISFFLLTFYPVLMRKLGGISSDLLVRESRTIQAGLGNFAKRFPDSTSQAEIARIVEEGLGQVPFVARASLWIRPVPHAEVHGTRRIARGGRRHLGRLLGRLLPHLPAGGHGRGGVVPLEGKDAVLPGTGAADSLPGRDRAGGGEYPPETEDPEEGALRHRRRACGGAGPRSAHSGRCDQGGGAVPFPRGLFPGPGRGP